MTTAITFSRQNDVGSRRTHYLILRNDLVLVVDLVLDSKPLYYPPYPTRWDTSQPQN